MTETLNTPPRWRAFIRRGSAMVWLSGAALALSLLMMVGLVGYIAAKGLGFFWPSSIVQVQTSEGPILGEISAQEKAHGTDPAKTQFRVCNRDLFGQDYRWVPSADIQDPQRPADAVLVERLENGPFIGFIQDGSSGETLVLRAVDGQTLEIPRKHIVRIVPSNALGVFGKSRVYASRLWEFVAGDPRESNTEGGVFPRHLWNRDDGPVDVHRGGAPGRLWPPSFSGSTPDRDG